MGGRLPLLLRVAVGSLVALGAWSWAPLLEALQEYPAVHAEQLGRLRKGKSGRFVFVRPYHGLGNREHALISSFGLALATRSALLVDWPGCSTVTQCSFDPAAIWDLYEPPLFEWTAAVSLGNTSSRLVRIGEWTFEAAARISHGTQAMLVNVNLGAPPWKNGSFVVHTDNHFLRAVLCNRRVARSGLFPPDALEAQRILEAALLRPSAPVRRRVTAHLSEGRACAVGVHLRKGQAPPRRADEVWPRLRDLLARHGADAHRGLFVAADPSSLDLKMALYDRARRAGLAVVAAGAKEPNATRGTKDGILDALAENHILSSCDALIPTNMSTFFNIAAVRATARPAVRAVFACDGPRHATGQPQTSPMDGSPQPCLFDAFCPDPKVGLPRGSNYYKHGQVDMAPLDDSESGGGIMPGSSSARKRP